MEAMVGDLPDEDDTDEPNIVERSDGTYLIDGKTLIYELNQYFQKQVIENNIARYSTIAGFVMSNLQDIPKPGDQVVYEKVRFEVLDIDGVRIDKVLMAPLEPAVRTE